MAARGGAAREVTDQLEVTDNLSFETDRYEIHIKGRLGDTSLSAFGELLAEFRPVVTVLHGELPDQAALYGVLGRIQSLGLELLEVRRLPRG